MSISIEAESLLTCWSAVVIGSSPLALYVTFMVVALPAGTSSTAEMVPARTVALLSAVGAAGGADGEELPVWLLLRLLLLLPVPLLPPVPPEPPPPPDAGGGGLTTVTATEVSADDALALEHLRLYVRVPAVLPTLTLCPLLLIPRLPLHEPLAVQPEALLEDHESVTLLLVVALVALTFRLAVGFAQAGRFALAAWCHGVVVLPMSWTQSLTGHLLSVKYDR